MIIQEVEIGKIIPYENNAKKHPEKQVEQIANSIREFGWQQPLVLDKNGVIIIGHGRYKAAMRLKMKTVPCVREEDLSEEQVAALRLVDNKLNESDWDMDSLEKELARIQDIDMTEFGLDLNDEWFNKQEEEKTDDQEDDEEAMEDVEKLEKHYGVPYQGNKSRIADLIIQALPAGKRLVDLFGGGGAITHCAMLSGKWESFLYNDLNKMITGLFMDAVNGKYHDERRVITREDFTSLKDEDAYVKYIWSFGNNGLAYLWGKNIEKIKQQACKILTEKDIKDRRLAYVKFIRMLEKNECKTLNRLQAIEHLQALTQLEALQRLETLQRLEVTNKDYREFEWQQGDVVYCDVPYEQIGKEKCDDYEVIFDSKAFYEWVKSRDYPVFFSSYEISDKSFHRIKVKQIQSLIGANTNGKKVTEWLYSNRPFEKTKK